MNKRNSNRVMSKLKDIITSCFGRECMKCGSTNNIKLSSLLPKSKYDLHNFQVLCDKCNTENQLSKITDYRTDDDKLSLLDYLTYHDLNSIDKVIKNAILEAKYKLKAKATRKYQPLKTTKKKKVNINNKLTKETWMDAVEFRQLAFTTLAARYGNKCARCGSHRYIKIDHIYPIRDFPRRMFDITNMQLLCSACRKYKLRSIEDYRSTNVDPLIENRLLRVRIPHRYRNLTPRKPIIDKPFKPKTILRKSKQK